jgi:hypothetical protein
LAGHDDFSLAAASCKHKFQILPGRIFLRGLEIFCFVPTVDNMIAGPKQKGSKGVLARLPKHFVLAAARRKHKIYHWLGTMIFRLPPSAASTKSKSCLEAFFCEGSNIFVSCPLFTT